MNLPQDDFSGDIGVFVGFNASLNENNSDGVVVLDLPQSGGKGKKNAIGNNDAKNSNNVNEDQW